MIYLALRPPWPVGTSWSALCAEKIRRGWVVVGREGEGAGRSASEPSVHLRRRGICRFFAISIGGGDCPAALPFQPHVIYPTRSRLAYSGRWSGHGRIVMQTLLHRLASPEPTGLWRPHYHDEGRGLGACIRDRPGPTYRNSGESGFCFRRIRKKRSRQSAIRAGIENDPVTA